MRYLKVPATKGRKFILSDAHGHFDTVLRALDEVNFDPAEDLVFGGGDYIDRGKDSKRAIRFLKKPWVKAVLGNHEKMVLDLYEHSEPEPKVLEFFMSRNGFGWWRTASDEVRQDFLDVARTLPYVIETETSRGRVGVLHAEVPIGMSWQSFVDAVVRGDERTLESTIWGRKRIKYGIIEVVPGIDRIFVGHTVVAQPVRLGNIFYLDTGNVFSSLEQTDYPGGHLTFADMVCKTQMLTLPVAQPNNGMVVRDTPSNAPFSAYTK